MRHVSVGSLTASIGLMAIFAVDLIDLVFISMLGYEALAAAVRYLSPRHVVGVGRFAADRATAALDPDIATVGTAPHPSPASPAANRGWPEIFERALVEIGIRP